MKKTCVFSVILLLFVACQPKINLYKTDKVKIYGNSFNSKCKETIENAVLIKNVSKIKWYPQNQQAKITYNANLITKESILIRVAMAGYDNEFYSAPDSIFDALLSSSKYVRELSKEILISNPINHNICDLLAHYLNLENYLYNQKGESASLEARKMLNDISKISQNDFSANSYKTWLLIEKELILNTALIATIENTKEQEKLKQKISNCIMLLLQDIKRSDNYI